MPTEGKDYNVDGDDFKHDSISPTDTSPLHVDAFECKSALQE